MKSMKTLAQLVSAYNVLALAAGMPERKGFENKAKAEEAIKSLKKKSGASLKVRKAGAVHNKGPRGFKFGPVWLKSITDGAGVALRPANFPKLKETAEAYGVKVTADLNQAEVAGMVAKAL